MSDLQPDDVDYIVLHCTAGRLDATVEEIRRYHTSPLPDGRGWADIGYHLLVDHHGKVHGGRKLWKEGAQAVGFNARSIGLAWIGDFDAYDPTPEAWRAMLALCHALRAAYEVPLENVIGHRETFDHLGQRRRKSCPGSHVSLVRFRAQLKTWTDNPDPPRAV